MSKIPAELENPLDNLIIRGCAILTPNLRSFGPSISPNHITTASFVMGGFSVYLLGAGFPITSTIFLFASYCLDCLDGFYARTYGLVTVFGDYYDHVTDWTVNVGYAWVLCRGQSVMVVGGIALLLVPLLLLQTVYLTAIEKYYDHPDESRSLSIFAKIGGEIESLEDAVETLKWSRYFACGTYYATLILVTIAVSYGELWS